MSSFKIETAKWKWAEKVQSKSVYRDEEFVVTATKEEALDAIKYLMGRATGLTYTITVERDGKFYTHFRHSMPCLGGLVKYRDSHGPTYFMNPYFPRDIYVAFPEGNITYIACHRPTSKDILKNPYWEFVFSQESPWVSAFGTKESVIFEPNYFVLTDMNTDPTVFYSLMRLAGFAGGYGGYGNQKDWNPKATILLTKYTAADPRRLAGQKPMRISGGTWAEGFGYTRPYNESIFHTKLPHKLKDFGKLSGYPQSTHSAAYFTGVMKDKFGIAALNKPDKAMETALLAAWDYFKEESASLDQ